MSFSDHCITGSSNARASLRCSFEVPRSAQSFVRSANVIKFLKAEFHAILQLRSHCLLFGILDRVYSTNLLMISWFLLWTMQASSSHKIEAFTTFDLMIIP